MKESFDSLRQTEHHIDDSIRLYQNREADDYPPHWHSAIEMIMPVENTYTLLVGETAYPLAPGEIFIVPAGVVHEIFAPEQGFRYLFMMDQEEFYAIEGMAEVQHALYPCVHLRLDRDAEVLREAGEYFRRAAAEYVRDGPLAPAASRLWLRLMLVRTVEYLLSGQAGERTAATPRQQQVMTEMMRVCAYISEYCASRLTLEDVAAYSGYSKYHFARVFKLCVGMSFYDYYMRQRMVLCRRLLSDSTLRVTEVALRCGFDSIATFNRVFKQFEGVTPSQYRKLRQYKRGQEV